MSRIGSEECFVMDMEWYGVDRRGNIAVFCSAGEGCIPEFVCEDRERAEALIGYFNGIEKRTTSELCFRQTERAEQVARDFSDRGFYHYDADDGTKPGVCVLHGYYTKQSFPKEPSNFASLPTHIQEILKQNVMEIEDFSLEDTVQVKHAYE